MRTALAEQKIIRAGLVPAYAAANADGHSIPNNDGRTFIHVKTGATPTNVTILTPGTVDGNAVADKVEAILANSEQMLGPYPPEVYNQPGTNEVHVDLSAVANVTIGLFRL